MSKKTQSTSGGRGPARIRHLNRRAVLSHLRYEGDNSRSALGPALSLSAAAVSSVVNDLLEDQLVLESENRPRDGRQGRPISLLSLNPEAAYAFGIVLRPTKTSTELAMAWVDYTGKTTALPDLKVDKHQDADVLIKSIVEAVSLLEAAVPFPDRVFGLTLAVPGVVENDTIPMSPKLTCIEGSEFIKSLREVIDYPLTLENDVNLAATSELYQQPRLRDIFFAYLYLYTGVGSGLSLKGQVLKGSGGWAGEIGSLHVNKREPNTTSFEHLLSTDGSLADLLEDLGEARDDLDTLADYIDKRDPKVLEVVDIYCEHICDAINVLNSVLDLDEVLIDFRSDELFKRLKPRLEILLQSARRQPVISTPLMGHEATLNGAALAALNHALETIETQIKD